jgi:hypothetical protein
MEDLTDLGIIVLILQGAPIRAAEEYAASARLFRLINRGEVQADKPSTAKFQKVANLAEYVEHEKETRARSKATLTDEADTGQSCNEFNCAVRSGWPRDGG